MDNPSAADIDCHMSRIADNIARLRIFIADCLSAAALRIRRSRQGDAKMLVDRHDKIGTIRSRCQAGTSKDIRIPQELARIGHYVTAADSGRVGRG